MNRNSELDLPNLMLIGAAKSGTTALANLLSQHTDIYVPKEKEVHFFDSEINYAKGITFYNQSFQINCNYKCDATPSYLASHETVIPRIKESMEHKHIKFIIILRNPIDRAWSHYNHIVRARGEKYSFMKAMTKGSNNELNYNQELWKNYYSDGLYEEQIKAWYSAFDQNQFHIMFFEEFINNKKGEMNKIFDFLGVQHQNYELQDSAKNPMSKTRSTIVRSFLNNVGFIRSISRIIVPNRKIRQRIIKRIKSINKRNLPNEQKEKMNNEDRKVISYYYQQSIIQLKKRLNNDLSFWKDF